LQHSAITENKVHLKKTKPAAKPKAKAPAKPTDK
jgi:hypothetical protein